MSGETPLDLRKDILDALNRVEGKLDNFILVHANQHMTEQQGFSTHLLNSAVMGEREKTLTNEVDDLKEEVGSLKSWQSELKGAGMFAKAAFGTSALAALLAFLALLDAASKMNKPT